MTAINVQRVMPVLSVEDIPAAVDLYLRVFRLRVAMDHGWIVALVDDDGHQIGLMTRDATAPVNPDVSVFVDDVDAAHEEAVAAGFEIVHPLTDEPWGVRRFFLRDSGGNVVNVGMHL